MSHLSLRRWIPILAVGVILSPSAASAAQLSWGSFLAEGQIAWSQIGEMLTGHLLQGGRLTKSEAPCGHGHSGQHLCRDSKPVPMPKVGCTINPDGQPHCAP